MLDADEMLSVIRDEVFPHLKTNSNFKQDSPYLRALS